MPQFIKVRFGPLDERRYTYLNDGDPVAVGDFVKVPDARNPDSWKRVEVMEVDVEEPNFACKAILGKVTGEDADNRINSKFASEFDPELDAHFLARD